MIRAVIDTNILVRALIKPDGSVGPILRLLRKRAYVILFSDPLLAELADVLSRPRICDKYDFGQDDIEAVLALILLRGEAVTPTRHLDVCRDPKDNMVLEVAHDGHAHVIVSGDEDLLTLHPYRGIPIVRPGEFLAMLAEQP